MKSQMRKLNDENGVTLVELLAAIAILSIIVTAFLGFFIQAARTNQHTNAVNEATFLAQEQMEEIIYNAPAWPVEKGEYEGTKDKNNYEIKTKLKISGSTGLHSVTVTVSDKGGKERAKMENILQLDGPQENKE